MVKRLQRLIVVLLAALLPAVGAYAQDATPKLNYNSEGGYYEIANEEDMIAFITFCRSSKSPTCTGMTFKVTASELDMGGDRFKHITGGFAGTFDGQGVVIKKGKCHRCLKPSRVVP